MPSHCYGEPASRTKRVQLTPSSWYAALAMLLPSLCWLLGVAAATVVWLWAPPFPLSVEEWQGAALPQMAVPASARDLVKELEV